MMDSMGGGWKDYKETNGLTGHAFAQITEQGLPCIDYSTRVRMPDVT